MLERWTIDSVAGEIESQFKGADPMPKLLRRFYREGLRHGRKGTSAEPMRHFLENVIEIATSKIAEEYLDEEAAAEAAVAGMKARRAMIDEDRAEAGAEDPGGLLDDAEAPEPSPAAGLGSRTAGPDLSGSLGRLRAARAAKESALAMERRRQKLAALDDELDGIEEELAIASRTLEDLPEKYRQLVESCHETGELMWTRYCLGYTRGTRRGLPDGDEVIPAPEIEFEYPDVLEPDERHADATAEEG